MAGLFLLFLDAISRCYLFEEKVVQERDGLGVFLGASEVGLWCGLLLLVVSLLLRRVPG